MRATGRFTALCMLPLLGVAACEKVSNAPVEPSGRASRGVSLSEARPFYYSRGRRIYLEEDSSEVVIASTFPSAGSLSTSAFANLGIAVEWERPLGTQGHRVVHLAGAPRALVREAISRLREDPRLDFVASSYKVVGTGAPILLVNAIDVEFKPEVTRSQIDSLTRGAGLSILRPPFPDSGFFAYRFRYPAGSNTEPLTVAANLHDSPLVKWAAPGYVGALTRSSAATDPLYTNQYYLRNFVTGGPLGLPVDINVEPAWDISTGTGLRVAIIDDGVDVNQGNTGGDLSTGQWGGAMGRDAFSV